MAVGIARAAVGIAMTGAVALGAAACAGVHVYSDPAMTKETGVKVFAPKPYLLVAHTGPKDALDLSIVFLPDTSDALYVRQTRGWGSSDLGVKLTNGMLAEFGSKSGGGIGEITAATASLLRAASTAYRASQLSAPPRAADAEPAAFEFYEIRQEHGTTMLVRVHEKQ
jgi:hypothetical protein